MPIYRYTTKDYEGKYHKGEIESANESQAANLLRKKKLIVLSLKERNPGNQTPWEKLFNRVAFSDVVVMTRQFATMIQSGLVLTDSLDILKDQQTNPYFKSVLEKISNDVKGGIDFASSLEKYPDVFPSIYSKLVRAGQASGKLDTILLELAENMEKERAFNSKIRGAMIYPIVVVGMMAAVMLIMVFFVMPKMLSLYQDSGVELPLPTKILIAITDFSLNYWWLVLLIIVVVVISFKKYISTPAGRLNIDTLILKLPIIGRITTLVILSNFTRTFALLISSGLSILATIKIVSDISGNLVYKNGFDTIYRGVERGLPFSDQILALDYFPKIVGQMAKTGEETGKLDEVMSKIADYFQSETDESLKNVTTLIEPIVIVMLGLGVAFLVISIILPIYQLTTSIK